jgi:hypothetical protein
MLKIKITSNNEVYKLRWWLVENIGEEKHDWWLTPLKETRRASAYDPFRYDYEMDLHILDGAKETFCQLTTTGRYFEVWNSQEIRQTI